MATTVETKKAKWLGGGEVMIDGSRFKVGGKELQKLQGVPLGTMVDVDVKSVINPGTLSPRDTIMRRK